MKADSITLSWSCGTISELYEQAVRVAKEFKCPRVEFPFNGIKVVVSYRSLGVLDEGDYHFILLCVDDKKDVYV